MLKRTCKFCSALGFDSSLGYDQSQACRDGMQSMLACRYASIDLVCDRLTRKLRKVKDKAIAKGKWQGRGGPKGSSSIKQQEVQHSQSCHTHSTHSWHVIQSHPKIKLQSAICTLTLRSHTKRAYLLLQATVETTEEDSDAEFAEEPEPRTPQPAQASHDSPAAHEVMRTKNFFLKPMTVEAAVEQCDQLGHDFYVFRVSSSDQVQVVYKRRTTGYGVIVPVNEE